MAFMRWDDEWTLDIPLIDDQHRRLLRMIDEFHDAMAMGMGHETAAALLCTLVEYTRTHFATEEQYMREVGFPGAVVHRYEHEKLIAQIEGYRAKVDNGELDVTIELMEFLRAWLTGHIAYADRKYGDHARKKT